MRILTKQFCIILLTTAGLLQAAPTIGSWNVTGGWEELFLADGNPGQTGNQISAIGDNWHLEGFLQSVVADGANQYTTTYSGGWVKLFDGAWGLEADLDNSIDTFTVVTNKYYDGDPLQDDSNLTRLTFELTGTGIFTSFPDYSLSIRGSFDSEQSDWLFIAGYGMMGQLTSGNVTITGPNVIPAPGAITLVSLGAIMVQWLHKKRFV